MSQWIVNSDDLRRGIALFNGSEFFEAHEVLEDVWRAAPKDQKRYFQGLVQIAVAYHHFSTGNEVGMRSVMQRAMRNLEDCPAEFYGIKAVLLKKSVAHWLDAFDARQPLPPLPRMEIAMGAESVPRNREI